MKNNSRLQALLSAGLLVAGAATQARSAGTFLLPRLERTAQSHALGEGAAFVTGLNALGVNPAALHSGRYEFLAQHQPLPLGASTSLIGAAVPLNRLGATIAASFANLKSGSFEGRDAQGRPSGSFDAEDRLMGVHVSGRLTERRPGQIRVSPAQGLLLGGGVKFATSRVASYSGMGLMVDLGARYAPSGKRWAAGLAVTNLGRGPKLLSESSPLPTTVSVAGAYRLSGLMGVTASLARRNGEKGFDLNVGMEALVGGSLSLRARAANGGGAGQGMQIVGGLGLKLKESAMLDYSFQPLDGALAAAGYAGLHKMTITFRLGGPGEARSARASGPVRYSEPAASFRLGGKAAPAAEPHAAKASFWVW